MLVGWACGAIVCYFMLRIGGIRSTYRHAVGLAARVKRGKSQAIAGLPSLKRRKYLGATRPLAGEGYDRQLLDQFLTGPFEKQRTNSMQSRWRPDYRSVEAYTTSVESNRRRLKDHLGRLHDERRGEVAAEERVEGLRADETDSVCIHRLAIRSRVPALSFSAYLVRPRVHNHLSDIGVVALHGHNSSAEKLAGLGAEDYGRRLALRLARRGFTVIAPNINSSTRFSNAISAHAALYGYTLYGIMAQFVQSCVDILLDRIGVNRAGCYGISNGALVSLFATATDDRLMFSVIAGLLCSFYDKMLRLRNVGESREYFFYFNGPFWTEFDIPQLALLAVPNILVFSAGTQDEVTRGCEQQYAVIEGVYRQLGIKDRVDLVRFNGGHEVPEELATDCLLAKLGLR